MIWVTGLRAGRQVIISQQGLKRVQTGSASYTNGSLGSFSGVKRPERGANYVPLYSADLNNDGFITPLHNRYITSQDLIN
jgi:hypothetical protein